MRNFSLSLNFALPCLAPSYSYKYIKVFLTFTKQTYFHIPASEFQQLPPKCLPVKDVSRLSREVSPEPVIESSQMSLTSPRWQSVSRLTENCSRFTKRKWVCNYQKQEWIASRCKQQMAIRAELEHPCTDIHSVLQLALTSQSVCFPLWEFTDL